MGRHRSMLKSLAESLRTGTSYSYSSGDNNFGQVVNEINSIKSNIASALSEISEDFEDLEVFKEKLFAEALKPLSEGMSTIAEDLKSIKKMISESEDRTSKLEGVVDEFVDLYASNSDKIKEQLEKNEADKGTVEEVLDKMTTVIEAVMENRQEEEDLYTTLFEKNTEILEDLAGRVKKVSDIIFKSIVPQMEEPGSVKGNVPSQDAPGGDTAPEKAEPEPEPAEDEGADEGEKEEEVEKEALISRLADLKDEMNELEEQLKGIEDIKPTSMDSLETKEPKEDEEEEKKEEKLESPTGGDSPEAEPKAEAPEAEEKPEAEGEDEKKEDEGEKEEPKEEVEQESEEPTSQNVVESLLNISKQACLEEGAPIIKDIDEREAGDDERPFREDGKPEETKESS